MHGNLLKLKLKFNVDSEIIYCEGHSLLVYLKAIKGIPGEHEQTAVIKGNFRKDLKLLCGSVLFYGGNSIMKA